jgi:hypothetical protein
MFSPLTPRLREIKLKPDAACKIQAHPAMVNNLAPGFHARRGRAAAL